MSTARRQATTRDEAPLLEVRDELCRSEEPLPPRLTRLSVDEPADPREVFPWKILTGPAVISVLLM